MSKAKSNYTLITLNDGRMVIEHKGKFAYFGAVKGQSHKSRFDKIKHRLQEMSFEDKKHDDSDVKVSAFYRINYDAF